MYAKTMETRGGYHLAVRNVKVLQGSRLHSRVGCELNGLVNGVNGQHIGRRTGR